MSAVFHTSGFSDAAEFVDSKSAQEHWRLRQLNVFSIDVELRNELATVWEDCREPNWDGYQAMAVSQDTLRNTYKVLESLPTGFPAPAIGAEPDGDMTLEWHRSPRRTLSVSVSPEGELHYSAFLGTNRAFGTETFFGDVPPIILSLIRRVHTA